MNARPVPTLGGLECASSAGASTPGLFPINLTPVADPDHENEHGAVLDIGNDPIVADSIFPEATQFAAFQRFAEAAGVVELGDTLGEESEDAPGGLTIEFGQVLQCKAGKLNLPGHTASLRLREVRSRYGRRELR